ncbi:MAG: PAS domain S-box protein [Bacteroidia bacterium]
MGDKSQIKDDKFYKALIENGNEILTMFNKDCSVIYRSPANERILGYTSSENPSINLELIHPDDKDKVLDVFKESLKNPDKPIHMALKIKAKSGIYLSFEGSITNMLHVDGVNAIVSNYYDVTNRNTAESELIESKEKFVTLVNTVKGIVWEADAETIQFSFVSKQAEEILGYPVEEWIEDPDFWSKHVHNEDKEWTFDYCINCVKQKLNHEFEYRMIAADGSIVWLQDIVTVIVENDKPTYLRGIMVDITERKKAEEALIFKDNYFKNLIKHSASAIILFNADGKFIYQSPAVNKIMGYIPDEDSATTIFQFIHPDEAKEFYKLYINLLKNPGGKVKGEFRFLHNDGHYIWLEGIVSNLLHDPNVNAFIANYQDVTERKNTQAKLEKSEANLHTIFDNTETGYILMDPNLNMLSFNKPAQKFSEEDLKRTLVDGANAIDYFPVERKAFMKRKMTDALAGNSLNHVLSYPQNDGSNRWYFMQFYPLYNFEKKVFGLVMALTDVTERKMYELQRKKITQDLLQRNKAQEQFTYIVSHNLRSPVANIIGVSKLLQEGGLSEEEKDMMMGGLVSSAHKLEEVITDLNQILQVKRDMRESKKMVKFKDIVKDVEATIGEWIKNEKVKILTDFSEVEEMLTLKSYLNSIFYNLISNSVKYRRTGIQSVIEIKSSLKKNKLQLSFKDNGMGIDLEKKGDQVFGLYKRFHTFVEGRGMGLYMVKTQVETLGGKIGLTSKVNEGTEFIIEFEN